MAITLSAKICVQSNHHLIGVQQLYPFSGEKVATPFTPFIGGLFTHNFPVCAYQCCRWDLSARAQ